MSLSRLAIGGLDSTERDGERIGKGDRQIGTGAGLLCMWRLGLVRVRVSAKEETD